MTEANPFFKGEPEPAEPAATPEPAETPESADAASIEWTPPDEPPADDDDGDESPADDFSEFAADDKESAKKNPHDGWVPKPRLDRVIGERNELRADRDALTRNVERLQGENDALKAITEHVQSKYRGNPDLLRWDGQFMDLLEARAKQDPATQQLVSQILTQMKGDTPVSTKTPETPTPSAATPESSETTEAVMTLIQTQARRNITNSLVEAGVKPHFAKLVAEDVVRTADTAKLADVDQRLAVDAAKVFFHDIGVPASEFLTKPPAAASSPATTTTGTGAAVVERKASGNEPDPNAPKPAASLEEFQKNKRQRFSSLAGEFVNNRS